MYGNPAKYWRTANLAGADKVPLLADAWWDQAWAEAFDWIPEYPGEVEFRTGDDMSHFCLIRHDGGINGIFLDGSAKRIELQCLWPLKWNRLSDVEDAPTEYDYPDWLRELPECNLELQ
jgi:prepilin-type processing-associated H-X9-DG protein